MEEIAQQAPSVFLRSYPSLLIGSFAGLALILAVIGREETHEFIYFQF